MCTIVLLHQVRADYPLVLAANRDEFYARPTQPPQVVSHEPRAVAGLDGSHGGTWMGATATGFFVGITNQRTFFPPDRTRRSRGGVALQALRLGSMGAVRSLIAGLNPSHFNSFNMVYGDGHELEVAYLRAGGGAPEVVALDPGVHVLANDRLGSPEFPKAFRAEARVLPALHSPWSELLDTLHATIADHTLPPPSAVPAPPPGARLGPELLRQLQALCVHTETYGTRSATVLALRPGRTARYLHADGPPCSTPLTDQTALLHDQ